MADLLVPSVTPQFSEAPMRAPEIVAPHIYAPNIQNMNQSNAFANNPILDAAYEYAVKANMAGNKAMANQAVTEYNKRIQADLDKLATLSGQEQVEFATQLQKSSNFVDYGNEVLKKLDGYGDAQDLASARMQEIYDKSVATVARTELEAKVKWNQKESESTANQLAQEAGRAIGTPEFDAKMNQMVEQGVNQLAKSHGITIGSEQYNDLLLKYNDGVYDSAVTQMIGQRQWGQAQSMLNAYKERMSFDTWGKLNLRLRNEKEHYEMVQANRAAAEAQKAYFNEERARKRAEDMFKPMSAVAMNERIERLENEKLASALADGAALTPELKEAVHRDAVVAVDRMQRDLINLNKESYLIQNEAVKAAKQEIASATDASQFYTNPLSALDKYPELKDGLLASVNYDTQKAIDFLVPHLYNNGASNQTRMKDYMAQGAESLQSDPFFRFIEEQGRDYSLATSMLMAGAVVQEVDGKLTVQPYGQMGMSYAEAEKVVDHFRKVYEDTKQLQSKDMPLKNAIATQLFGKTYEDIRKESSKGTDVYANQLYLDFVDEAARNGGNDPFGYAQRNFAKVERLKEEAEAREQQELQTFETYADYYDLPVEEARGIWGNMGLNNKTVTAQDLENYKAALENRHKDNVETQKARQAKMQKDSSLVEEEYKKRFVR